MPRKKPKDEERPSQLVKTSKRYRAELRAFGMRVRTLREVRGWTQETTAERADLDVTHLAKIERGVVNLTFGTIVRLAEGLDEPVATLFTAPRGRRQPRRRGNV
jgi:XRE family transcriptional regulator, regulator of sulfur utilization